MKKTTKRIVALIITLVNDTFALDYSTLRGGSFFLYSPILIFGEWMDKLFCGEIFEFDLTQNLSFITFILLAVGAGLLFVKLNKEEKSENTSQISNSWFAYRTLIPCYSVLATTLLFMGNGLIAAFISIIKSIDREAFVTIHRAHEINGEGWTKNDLDIEAAAIAAAEHQPIKFD